MKVLTVCLGNICRSPAAQGILESVAKQQGLTLSLDSAGTAAYHIGKQPDSRSIRALAEVGIDISQQRARQVRLSDFEQFDWIVAMDAQNLANLRSIAPEHHQAKVVMFGAYRDGVSLGEVDDPYYGGDVGFVKMREHLFTIAEDFLSYLSSKSVS